MSQTKDDIKSLILQHLQTPDAEARLTILRWVKRVMADQATGDRPELRKIKELEVFVEAKMPVLLLEIFDEYLGVDLAAIIKEKKSHNLHPGRAIFDLVVGHLVGGVCIPPDCFLPILLLVLSGTISYGWWESSMQNLKAKEFMTSDAYTTYLTSDAYQQALDEFNAL